VTAANLLGAAYLMLVDEALLPEGFVRRFDLYPP
jgi:hypothetical protein